MEVFHLRWVDIHLNTGTIDAVAREEHPTKNYETRSIPMTQALIAELKRHPRRLGFELVFPNSAGEPYYKIEKPLSEAVQRASIDKADDAPSIGAMSFAVTHSYTAYRHAPCKSGWGIST